MAHCIRIINFGPCSRSHLTCYIGDKFYRSYPAHSDIFCISIVGDRWFEHNIHLVSNRTK